MGITCAPTYENTVMAEFEQKHIYPLETQRQIQLGVTIRNFEIR